MKKILAVVVVVVLVGVGWYLVRQRNEANDSGVSPSPTAVASQSPLVSVSTSVSPLVSTSASPVAKEHVVIYTNDGYSPSTITIKKGETVVWKNQSSASVWTASAVHPSHAVYDGTSLSEHCSSASVKPFDECKKEASGTSWSFKFDSVGTWGYHNHANSRHFGKVMVEQ